MVVVSQLQALVAEMADREAVLPEARQEAGDLELPEVMLPEQLVVQAELAVPHKPVLMEGQQ